MQKIQHGDRYRCHCISNHLDFLLIDPDSRISRAGEDVPRYLRIGEEMLVTLKTYKDVTFVLTRHTIQEEGYLAGIEVIVAKPGPIRILVGSQTFYVRNVANFWHDGHA